MMLGEVRYVITEIELKASCNTAALLLGPHPKPWHYCFLYFSIHLILSPFIHLFSPLFSPFPVPYPLLFYICPFFALNLVLLLHIIPISSLGAKIKSGQGLFRILDYLPRTLIHFIVNNPFLFYLLERIIIPSSSVLCNKSIRVGFE